MSHDSCGWNFEPSTFSEDEDFVTFPTGEILDSFVNILA